MIRVRPAMMQKRTIPIRTAMRMNNFKHWKIPAFAGIFFVYFLHTFTEM